MNESHYRDLLAETVGGRTEVSIKLGGRADVMTSTDVYEVEPLGTWKVGLRQALGYAAFSGLRGNLAVFGFMRSDEAVALFLQLREAPIDIGLWLYDANRGWSRITSRKDAHRVWTLQSLSSKEQERRDLERRRSIQARWDYRQTRRDRREQREQASRGNYLSSGICSKCRTPLLPNEHMAGCIPSIYDFTQPMQNVIRALIAAQESADAQDAQEEAA